MLPSSINLLGLSDIGFSGEIPETSGTIEGNASQKAFFIWENYKKNCFADDTGLEVAALGGDPGVMSARYAGPEAIAENNIRKLLRVMQGIEDRRARFKTVISLVMNGKEKSFTGEIRGILLREKRGSSGFGYDPIFLPDGYAKTFAEMSPDEKNKISHRALAVKKLVDYLRSLPAGSL